MRKFQERTVNSFLIKFHLLSMSSRGRHFSLCVIDAFSNYAWVILLKDKKEETITKTFIQNILKESHCKPNNI